MWNTYLKEIFIGKKEQCKLRINDEKEAVLGRMEGQISRQGGHKTFNDKVTGLRTERTPEWLGLSKQRVVWDEMGAVRRFSDPENMGCVLGTIEKTRI